MLLVTVEMVVQISLFDKIQTWPWWWFTNESQSWQVLTFGVNCTQYIYGRKKNWCMVVWQNYTAVYSTMYHDDVMKWKKSASLGLLWGESTGHRWIPFTKASDAELRYFLWSAHVKQTIETPSRSFWRHGNVISWHRQLIPNDPANIRVR